MFHLMAYANPASGVNDTNVNIPAVNDTIFNPRNNAFIFTEDWQILWLAGFATSMLRVRSNVPKWNAINRHHLFGINRSNTVPSPFNLQDLRKEPLRLPQNEQVAWEESNNLGAATEQTHFFQAIAPLDWNMDLPTHLQRLTVRFTGAVAGVIDAWSGPGAITFPDQDLRGGVYSIVGCQMFDAGTKAYRFILPRGPMTQGRLLRPGGISLEAVNNIVHPIFNAGLGEWGRFHTFELPQIEIFANASGASVQEGRLDLLYLGEDERLLNMAL